MVFGYLILSQYQGLQKFISINIEGRLRVDISMVVMYDASDVTGYDSRGSELSYALLHMK